MFPPDSNFPSMVLHYLSQVKLPPAIWTGAFTWAKQLWLNRWKQCPAHGGSIPDIAWDKSSCTLLFRL